MYFQYISPYFCQFIPAAVPDTKNPTPRLFVIQHMIAYLRQTNCIIYSYDHELSNKEF